MTYLKKEELMQISGGLNITGSLIASFVKGIDLIFDIGRSLGTAIRRAQTKNLCPL